MSTSKITELIDTLGRKTEGNMLVNDVERIRKRAEPLLAKIIETFPEYTIHDIRHSQQLLRILNWVIPQDLQDKMNAYELFFFIAHLTRNCIKVSRN